MGFYWTTSLKYSIIQKWLKAILSVKHYKERYVLTMNLFKKILAGVLAAATMVAVSGCSGDTNWVYRNGENEVTAGMYIGYGMESCQSLYYNDQIDTTKALNNQTIDDIPVVNWLEIQTQMAAKRYLIVEKLFNEYGLSFTEEEQASIKNTIDYYWNYYYGVDYEAQGCGYGSFSKMIENTYKQDKLFTYTYSEEGPSPVNADEMRASFDSDYTKMKYFTISLMDEEGEALSEKDVSLLVKEAEALAKRIEDGESLEKVRCEYYETEYDEEEDSSIVVALDSTYYTTAVMDTVKELKDGKAGVGQSEKYLYIVERIATDDEDYDATYPQLLSELKSAEFNNFITEETAALEAELNEKAAKKYAPKKLLS